ncbi:MAG: YggT family protein [Candidatus Omnitrophica bacterium]|nr:YggT family protein [Candidatus Omnitrophota bacterium]
MFVIGRLLISIASVLNIILSVLWWLILIRALISWVSPDPFNPIVQALYRFTEPVLQLIRNIMPFSGGMDFSPLIAFFLIVFLKSFVVGLLYDFGLRLTM